MTETVDLERSNPFPMIVSYTGTPFTKGKNLEDVVISFQPDFCPRSMIIVHEFGDDLMACWKALEKFRMMGFLFASLVHSLIKK